MVAGMSWRGGSIGEEQCMTLCCSNLCGIRASANPTSLVARDCGMAMGDETMKGRWMTLGSFVKSRMWTLYVSQLLEISTTHLLCVFPFFIPSSLTSLSITIFLPSPRQSHFLFQSFLPFSFSLIALPVLDTFIINGSTSTFS